MKKLTKILNSVALFSAPVIAAVPYAEQESTILKEISNKNIANNLNANLTSAAIIVSDTGEEQLEQLNEEIEAWLADTIIIADGENTYKTEKEKIKVGLSELAANKNVTLGFEFINSVFEAEDDLVYKTENPFEIKVDLISDDNEQITLSKTYKAPSIEGLSKEDISHKNVKQVIKSIFASKRFVNNLSNLIGVKVNGQAIVKDVVDAFAKLTNVDIFGENEDINKYQFQYSTSLNENDKLVIGQALEMNLNVYDTGTTTAFLTTKFKLRVKGETDLEKYWSIVEKINNYLSNKKLDLSIFKELDADGETQWRETLWKILNPKKINDYFKFEKLGNAFEMEYADVVAFNLSLDNSVDKEINESQMTFNSEQNYISVILNVSKKGSDNPIYPEKSVTLKLKVGGLTKKQIFEKTQKETMQIFYENVNGKSFSISGDTISRFLSNYTSIEWTWSNLLSYLKDNFFTYFKFDKLNITQEKITDRVDFEFLNIFDADKKENLDLNAPIFDSVSSSDKNEIQLRITPKKGEGEINDDGLVASFYQDFSHFHHASRYHKYFDSLFLNNVEFFNKETVIFKQESDGSPLKLRVLHDYVEKELKKFLSKDIYMTEISKYFSIWSNIMDQDKTELKDHSKLDIINIKNGTYYFYFYVRDRKYDSGAVATDAFSINVEIQ